LLATPSVVGYLLSYDHPTSYRNPYRESDTIR
jgi:hypothetical protein